MKRAISFINLALIGRELLKDIALEKLVKKVISFAILTIISSVIMCSLLIFTLYLIYDLILRSGVEPNLAFSLMSGLILFLMIIFTTLAFISFSKLQKLLEVSTDHKSGISKILESFTNGLLNK